MSGIDIKYTTRNHETFDGYLTQPAGNAEAPGILLITAIFGVDQEMRELADAWAADGFLVSVPDIFWRQIPGPTADMGVAFDRYGKFDPVQGMRDITMGPGTTSRCHARTAMTRLRRRSRANGCCAASSQCTPTRWSPGSSRMLLSLHG